MAFCLLISFKLLNCSLVKGTVHREIILHLLTLWGYILCMTITHLSYYIFKIIRRFKIFLDFFFSFSFCEGGLQPHNFWHVAGIWGRGHQCRGLWKHPVYASFVTQRSSSVSTLGKHEFRQLSTTDAIDIVRSVVILLANKGIKWQHVCIYLQVSCQGETVWI